MTVLLTLFKARQNANSSPSLMPRFYLILFSSRMEAPTASSLSRNLSAVSAILKTVNSASKLDQESCGKIPTGNIASYPQYAGYLKAEVVACNEAITASGLSTATTRYSCSVTLEDVNSFSLRFRRRSHWQQWSSVARAGLEYTCLSSTTAYLFTLIARYLQFHTFLVSRQANEQPRISRFLVNQETVHFCRKCFIRS